MKRKPDLETESFKARVVPKKEEKKYKEGLKEEHPIIIKDGKWKFQLCGFNKVLDKKTGKLVLAWKVKAEQRVLLYYLAEDLTEKNKQKIKLWFEETKKMADRINYEVKDAREWFKNLSMQKHALEKIGERK